MWSAYLATSTCATSASVGMPFSISRSGARHHFAGAGAAGIFGAARHDHLQLRRDHVGPFGDILADAMLEGRHPAGAVLSSTSMRVSSRGRCGGSAPRLTCRLRVAASNT